MTLFYFWSNFSFDKVDFPAPKKEIEKIIPNENLKLLNSIYLPIIFIFFFIVLDTTENEPIDIWNIEDNKTENSIKF